MPLPWCTSVKSSRRSSHSWFACPTGGHLPVQRYVHPDAFAELERAAYAMGFRHAAVGALVRSSYHADEQLPEARAASA